MNLVLPTSELKGVYIMRSKLLWASMAIAIGFSVQTFANGSCHSVMNDISIKSSNSKFVVTQLIQKYPENMAMVNNVKFEYQATPYDTTTIQTFSNQKDVLIVSFAGHTVEGRKVLTQEVLGFIKKIGVTFPTSENLGHLYSQFGGEILDVYGSANRSQFYVFQDYNFGTNGIAASPAKKLEIPVVLSEAEYTNLKTYIANVYRDKLGTLGTNNYDGVTKSAGLLDNNKPTCEGGHNCTSWMAYSPIGKEGERLLQLVGGDLAVDQVGQNPGWWALYLLTKAKSDRVPFVIYYTTKTIEEAMVDVQSGQKLQFGLNPR